MNDQAKLVSPPWRRFLRFSVRGLIVLVLVIGGWVGWIVRSARIQREAIRAIKQADGEVSYDWEWANGVRTPAKAPKVPRRLVEAFGADYSGHVVHVSFSNRERTRLLRRAEQLLAELKNQSNAAIEKPTEPRDTLIGCTPEKSRIGPEPWEPNEIEAVLPLLKGLSGLSRLDLNGVDLTGDQLLWLEGLTSLTHLDLGRTRITDSRLRHLPTLIKLSELNLDETEITDAGLVHLKGLTSLMKLKLGRTRVTDVGLAQLSGLSALADLDLWATPITDAGLVHLSGLTNLSKLDLRGTRVTDTGLVHLTGLPRLSDIHLGTRVTDARVKELQQALPSLKIVR